MAVQNAERQSIAERGTTWACDLPANLVPMPPQEALRWVGHGLVLLAIAGAVLGAS